MENNAEINFKPSENDYNIIRNWLKEEYDACGEGFYCNRNIIEKAFYDNELISFELDGEIIGFAVCTQHGMSIDIDIIEIHPEYRKKGFGKIFFHKLESVFREKGNIAIILFCEPRESKYFWRKMGFIQFPDRGYSESDLTFYKPLIKVAKATDDDDNSNIIELWNVEPHEACRFRARWKWNVRMENGRLLNPIIQPCNCNWNIKWSKNGEIIKESKVKRFSREYSVEEGPFLYVTELKE